LEEEKKENILQELLSIKERLQEVIKELDTDAIN